MAELTPSSKSYQDLLARLKNQIRTAQLRAAVAVNQELVLLYYRIGSEILTRQKEDGWGTRVIERGYLKRRKSVFGFQTGDLVCAGVRAGKNQGRYVGRVAVRASGWFNIQTSAGVVQGIWHRQGEVLQRGDGYGYSLVAKHSGKESENRSDARRRALSLPGP